VRSARHTRERAINMRTAAHLVRTLALGTLAIPCSLVPSAALGAGAPAPAVSIPLPLSNLPQGGMVVSDTLLAYDLPDPPMHASDANNPFTNFHDRVFVVTLRAMGSGLAASTPRLIFTLPRGLTMTPWSINGGWLVYTQYSSTDPAGPWTLAARDIATGTVIALDSPAREGVPSAAAQAASDGRTVVWQSWTQADGRATSVIRSYDLTTGRRRLLAEGGSQDTWSYAWPGVSGQSVVFEKEMPDRQSPRAQILLADLATGRAPADARDDAIFRAVDLWRTRGMEKRLALRGWSGCHDLRCAERRPARPVRLQRRAAQGHGRPLCHFPDG